MKPYYEDEHCTIYNCDLLALPIGFAACQAIVTSPPYNVGIPYVGYDDDVPWADYWKFVGASAWAMRNALDDCGRVWVNIAPAVSGAAENTGVRRANLLAGWSWALESTGLLPHSVVAWVSLRGQGTAWGSYEQPSAPNLRGDWEAMLCYYQREWRREPPPNMEGWRDSFGGWPELVSNVWQIRPDTDHFHHPAPFPVELAERAIRLSLWPGETVLDPFMGSGATLVAAKALGRKAIGVEISERYCEAAVSRVAQEVLPL